MSIIGKIRGTIYEYFWKYIDETKLPKQACAGPRRYGDVKCLGVANEGGNSDNFRSYWHELKAIGRMSVFNAPIIKKSGVTPLAGQHLIDSLQGGWQTRREIRWQGGKEIYIGVTRPNTDSVEHPLFFRSDQDLKMYAEHLRFTSKIYREQARRMREFIKEELLAPEIKEQLIIKAVESDRIAGHLSELSMQATVVNKIQWKDRFIPMFDAATLWEKVRETSNTARIVFKPDAEQRGAAMVTGPNTDVYNMKQVLMETVVKKYGAASISDADQIDVPKKFKLGEAKEWKNVGAGYLSIIANPIEKLVALVRKHFK